MRLTIYNNLDYVLTIHSLTPDIELSISYSQDIEFKLLHDPEPSLGSDVAIELKSYNKSKNTRKITRVVISVFPQSYTGACSKKAIKTEEFTQDVKLRQGQGK
jgi:hypothetical protein